MSSTFSCVSCQNKRSKNYRYGLESDHNSPRKKIQSEKIGSTLLFEPMVEQKIPLLDTNSLDSETIPIGSSHCSINTIYVPAEQLKIDSISDTNSLNLQSTLSRIQPHDEGHIDDDEIEKLLTSDFFRTVCKNGNITVNKHLSNSSNRLTIRKQIEKQEYEEHQQLHGSKPNIYEYEIRQLVPKSHADGSQVSIVSDVSEKSFY
ncbi:unnamed protein product [Adineta ricciae]|uniref:Uncharacterized protein n=1 Tax=Adineta ricciae TaxID=249248 RepID=A0A814T9H7_ADIRI|nr:unnamed protein product [Adineta ricciae]CAF1401849.1 unnamed protein product [Adineta ricciae]